LWYLTYYAGILNINHISCILYHVLISEPAYRFFEVARFALATGNPNVSLSLSSLSLSFVVVASTCPAAPCRTRYIQPVTANFRRNLGHDRALLLHTSPVSSFNREGMHLITSVRCACGCILQGDFAPHYTQNAHAPSIQPWLETSPFIKNCLQGFSTLHLETTTTTRRYKNAGPCSR